MRMLTNVMAAAAVMCAFATPVFAQDTMMSEKQFYNVPDGGSLHVGANGKIRMMKGNAETNAMLMSKGTAVPAGTIFHWSGGKLYMMQDTKMDDGKMLSDRYPPAGGA